MAHTAPRLSPPRPATFRYEHHAQPLLPFERFAQRVAAHGGAAALVVAASLAAGACGYRWTEGMDWIDALLNASMILTGMGPVSPLDTFAGKLFASLYALYSGVVFLVVVGLMLAPFAHRLLHRFRIDDRDES